jgi:hypothetical protein
MARWRKLQEGLSELGVQTWEMCSQPEPHVKLVDPLATPRLSDPGVRHAQEQIALANDYPGRSRGLPSSK